MRVPLWGGVGKEVTHIDTAYKLVLQVLIDLIVDLGVIVNILFGRVLMMIL